MEGNVYFDLFVVIFIVYRDLVFSNYWVNVCWFNKWINENFKNVDYVVEGKERVKFFNILSLIEIL